MLPCRLPYVHKSQTSGSPAGTGVHIRSCIAVHNKHWEELDSLPPYVLHSWLVHRNVLSCWSGSLHMDRSTYSLVFFTLFAFPKPWYFVQYSLGDFKWIRYKYLFVCKYAGSGLWWPCIWICRPGFWFYKRTGNSAHLLDPSALFLGLRLSSRDQHGRCSVGHSFSFPLLSWIFMFTRKPKKTELVWCPLKTSLFVLNMYWRNCSRTIYR